MAKKGDESKVDTSKLETGDLSTPPANLDDCQRVIKLAYQQRDRYRNERDIAERAHERAQSALIEQALDYEQRLIPVDAAVRLLDDMDVSRGLVFNERVRLLAERCRSAERQVRLQADTIALLKAQSPSQRGAPDSPPPPEGGH